MNIAPAGVSLGGAVIGSIILILVLQRWWLKGSKGKGKGDEGGGGRSPKALIPFVLGTLYGMLIILCAGGIVAAIAGFALWGANGLGDMALIYGVGGEAPMVSRARQIALTNGGYAVVLIATALIGGAWRWAKKFPRLQVALGALCGICLGLNGGIAGMMALPLANTVNLAGGWWTGTIL